MATQHEKQAFIRHYIDVTGIREVDMHEVAKLAQSMGWKMPIPKDPLDLLAEQFSQAAREETRQDSKTGQPYRAYHAVKQEGQKQGVFWVDIDEAPRKHMVKSTRDRREQVIGDMVQLTLDLNHWNRVNPNEAPIILEKDLTPDVNERLAASEGSAEGEEAA
jgi:hypothetical protein